MKTFRNSAGKLSIPYQQSFSIDDQVAEIRPMTHQPMLFPVPNCPKKPEIHEQLPLFKINDSGAKE